MNTRTPNKPFKARKKDILRLRKKGLSYRAIAKKLGCSKGTISYHCGKNQTEKKRVRKANKAKGYSLTKKVTAFKSKCTKAQWRAFRTKIKGFKRKHKGGKRYASSSWRVHNVSIPYTSEDVINKIGSNPTCYLTGRKIDLNNTSSFTFDHRIPTVKGGTNDLDNLEICCTEANHAKAGLLLNDFYSLCEEILACRDNRSNKDGQKLACRDNRSNKDGQKGRRSSKR